MAEFLAMGGYAEFVWGTYALGVVIVIYNIVSARRRMRSALEGAALNAARARNRLRNRETLNGQDS
jgi:heme exporter protein CcmD